ncbi:unnamed protein product [Acanthoscelides obtectus]|uniref:Uncharacterized protein n=1 Tax=Acanthoscelides obtectus TaxID=200917 RepID=A0A9P0MJ59_ACAOB|nr:unnamed protein product [Acanthoscelides obtectus]CAK1630815.1 Transmembrane protein 189 [Acanthoscelides obtectus]
MEILPRKTGMALPLSCSQRVKDDLIDPLTSKVATNLLAPVKTERQILENSMLEDDPNGNCTVSAQETSGPRWGPQHKGAQELANLYSKTKRTQECVCVGICLTLMAVNFVFILLYIRLEQLSTVSGSGNLRHHHGGFRFWTGALGCGHLGHCRAAYYRLSVVLLDN